jgi:lysozyme
MKASNAIKGLIKSKEGLRLDAYDDGDGNFTIGYGHNLGRKPVVMKITLEEAEQLFVDDITIAETFVNSKITIPISQNAFDSLVSFTFNVGGNIFANSSVVKYINLKQNIKAVQVLLAYCHNNAGEIIPGLYNRRMAEGCILLGVHVDYGDSQR